MRGGKTLYALATALCLFLNDSVIFSKSERDERDPKIIRSAAGISSNEATFSDFETLVFGEQLKLTDLHVQERLK